MLAYRAATGQPMWLDRYNPRLGHVDATSQIAVAPDGRTLIAVEPLFGATAGYSITSYNASTGGTRWTRLAPSQDMFPAGLIIDPDGDTMIVGGNRPAAYSVADGSILWTAGYGHGFPSPIGLSGDRTVLFVTLPDGRGIVAIAGQP